MNSINYDARYIEFLDQLTKINPRIRVKREGDRMVVRLFDAVHGHALSVILSAPVSMFDMAQEKITFINFSDFYQYYKLFNSTPSIDIDDQNVYLNDPNDGSLMTYRISANQLKKREYPNPPAAEYAYSVNIDGATLNTLAKMVAKQSSKNTEITCTSDGKVNFRVVSGNGHHSFDKPMNATSIADGAESFELSITSDSFDKLPFKSDNYIIHIHPKVVRFERARSVDAEGNIDPNEIEFNQYIFKSRRV